MRIAHVRRAPVAVAPRPERGETLLEVLVTVILMGIGFTAVFGTLYTTMKVVQLNERRTVASTGVQSWAEGFQQPATQLTGTPSDPYTYVPCEWPAVMGQNRMPLGALPNAWKNGGGVKVLKLRVLNGYSATGTPTWREIATETDRALCQADGWDKGAQELTIQVASPDGTTPRVAETLVLVRRDQRCPALADYDNPDLGPC